MNFPSQTHLAIIGAGPQALTLVAHLLQKRSSWGRKFVVFDSSGAWLTQWHRQFAALEIPHLRSPAVHHPDPNPYELRRFAESRSSELYPPYDLPGTQLFQDFCAEVIRRWHLQDRVISALVVRVEPLSSPRGSRFRLHCEDGRSIEARRVVLASGGGVPHLPEWMGRVRSPYPPDRLCHSRHVDLRSLKLKGEQILIVGGGLTAGHLAVGALARGARVTLMARRELKEKLFDAEPGWLGPKYLKGFEAESDFTVRWWQVKEARDGGSMTPAMMLQLRRESRSGKLEIREACQVSDALWRGAAWQVVCDRGTTYEFDRIWLATGDRFDIATHPLLTDLQEFSPTKIVKGLPVLDRYLRWSSGCDFYIMGGFAALQIGPVARNLFGAKLASQRILQHL